MSGCVTFPGIDMAEVSGLFQTFLDLADIVLSVVGFIPGPGTACDGVAIVLNLIRRDPISAVLSVFSLIPIGGAPAGAAKIIYKAIKILKMFI